MFNREEEGLIQELFELRWCEMVPIDKIAKDLENAVRWHNSKIFYWHVDKLWGNSQSGFIPVKDRNGATISDKERFRER